MSKREVRYLWVVEGSFDQDDPDDWFPFRLGALSLKDARENKKELIEHGDMIYYRIRKYVPFIEK